MAVTCHQCSRPPLFQIEVEQGSIYLCLDCKLKLTQHNYMCNDMIERLINHQNDQMEMIAGVRGALPRFPARQIIQTGDTTLNNIHIDRSSIGVLNNGNIHTLDASITALNQAGDDSLATAIRTLTEAVAHATIVSQDEKNKILEILSVLAAESTVPQEKRRRIAMRPLLIELAGIIGGIDALSNIWEKYHSVIEAAFQ